MKPALVFPYNDPDGTMYPHIQAILPDLKEHFSQAYISTPPDTFEWLEQSPIHKDDFFTVIPVTGDWNVGERFVHLYQCAAEMAPPDLPLHLCFPDRLAFALEAGHRVSFLADMDSPAGMNLPLIFQRSEQAWETHPKNYREIEEIVTTVGRNLFGRELDYAWCHIVVRAGQLREIIPHVKNQDISMVAEIIYHLQDKIHTREVDWLAWEDPFILGRDAEDLKRERENSFEETQKRLAYVVPMIETLTRLSRFRIRVDV